MKMQVFDSSKVIVTFTEDCCMMALRSLDTGSCLACYCCELCYYFDTLLESFFLVHEKSENSLEATSHFVVFSQHDKKC